MDQEQGEVGGQLCKRCLGQSVHLWHHQGLLLHTLRSYCKSCDFSITCVKIELHFEASLTKAKTCFGDDLMSLELNTLDLREPVSLSVDDMRGAAS